MPTIADLANNWWNGLDILSQMQWVRKWKVDSKPGSEATQMSFNEVKRCQKSISIIYLKAEKEMNLSEAVLKVA